MTRHQNETRYRNKASILAYDDESKLNAGSWEDSLPSALTQNNNINPLAVQPSAHHPNNGNNVTTTTAQLHNISILKRPEVRGGLQTLIIPQHSQQPHHHHHHHHHHHIHTSAISRCSEAAIQQQQQLPSGAASVKLSGNTIAGGSFNANGGTSAVGVTSSTSATSAAPNSAGVQKHLDDSWCSAERGEHTPTEAHNKSPNPSISSEDEELAHEEKANGSATSSLSATNQRNSQLRSTFNRAKQHLSFDKWRSPGNVNNCAADNSTNSSNNAAGGSGTLTRRASTTTCSIMPTAHQPSREDITTPGETPGGRLQRWFSMKRGSSHQYDVGGRDGRQSTSSSIDYSDTVCDGTSHMSVTQKLTNSAHTTKSAYKMPGVPENEDDETSSLTASTNRFDLDLMIPPGSRANGTARTTHNRLMQPMLPPAPPGLSQQQLKRRHIVAAIVHSENSYVATLQRLVNVVSRINDLVGSLKGTYKELNTNITRNVMNSIQSSIQRKNEEMAWVDSCCLQLVARNKSGKEETFTFQTINPNVKKEWVTELRLAQLALDTNNSPAWETTSTDPIAASSLAYEQQQQMQLVQRQSNKMPLFVKAMPILKSQHQTEVRCGCYYSIANDSKISGNARRRHKQLNYLWICTSDGSVSHITVFSQHIQQAGNLRDVGSFDITDCQITAMEFVKGLENCKTREEYNSLLGDLIWMGTDTQKILIYSAKNPEQEEQLSCCTVTGTVMRILYHFDTVYVALSNATMLIYRRAYDGAWMLKDPQVVVLGESSLSVPSLLPINMNIYAACANRVYVLNALNGEIQKSFEVHHGANQQVNLMAHSGIGLWISLKNSTMLCLYHTETFKHLQDINIASSVLRSDGKKEQAVNNSAIYVTALMACKGLLWVGTNVGIAVTIPLPRLEGVPIISGGISMSCHAHFGPITFLLPLVSKVYPCYKPSTNQSMANALSTAAEPVVPSMGDDLQLPAIDADPKKIAEAELDESAVVLRRDLPKEEISSGCGSPSALMLRELSTEGVDSATSSPRCSKLDKQISLDQSFSAKIRAPLANSPAFHRKRFRDLSTESARMSKTLPRGLGSPGYYNLGLNSNTSTLNHSEHGYCDVYGLYGKLIYVKEDYDAAEGTQGNLMDMMYEGMRRSDPELAAIPGRVSTLDRRLRMKASRPRSLDLSNWSVDSKSSSLYTSSGSEESMGIRLFGGRSVSRNSSSASHKTSGNGSDLGNISENGLMTSADVHSTPKSEEGFKLMQQHKQTGNNLTTPATSSTPPPAAATATLKRKQKQNAKQQQQQQADGPRTIITLTGGRGYWRHVWYNNANSPGHKSSSSSSSLSSGSSTPLIANSNDAHIQSANLTTLERRGRVRFRGSFVMRERNSVSPLSTSPSMSGCGVGMGVGSLRRLTKLRRGGSLKEF
ncbi:hypothetical protein GQX74_007053 [Glossina fuscipes]|nr:hypothetical protein GQX74_007053 [Glossina fuscipes]